MDSVYNFLPEIIPRELHTLIHLFAGTCTPSCENIKIFNVHVNEFVLTRNLETHWVALLELNTPRYLRRQYENRVLTNWELDLKIAHYELKLARYLRYVNDNPGITSEFSKQANRDWVDMEVEKAVIIQTRRLRKKYKMMVIDDLFAKKCLI